MNTSWKILDSSASSDRTDRIVSEQLKVTVGDSSTSRVGHNFRPYQYSLLQHAIKTMMEIAAGGHFELDEETGKTASSLLALIENNYEVSPPRLLPHDRDVLALTWVRDHIKTLLTVEGDEVDLLTVDLRDQTQHSQSLSDDGMINLSKYVGILAGTEKTATK